MSLSPFVYWAQTETHVYLRADLNNIKSHEVCIEEEEVELTATASGANGEDCRYHFVIEFFLPVDKHGCEYEVRDSDVRFSLRKKEADWWPRLQYQNIRVPWLRIDFDKWREQDEEDMTDEDNAEGVSSNISTQDWLKNKYPEAYRKLEMAELGYISESKRKIYLFCYNLFMMCGYIYVVAIMNLRYAKLGFDDFVPTVYNLIGNSVKMLSLLSILEVLHPMFGYTKGNVLESGLRVFGRIFVIFALMEGEQRMQEKPVICYLFCIYATNELIRYPYYMFKIYDLEFDLLTWLRYTVWIPLLPAAFFCEGVVALRDIPYFEETEKFDLVMPNYFNMAFHFPTVIRFYLLFLFFPLLYSSMNRMYHLRCKKLGIRQHERNRKKDDDYDNEELEVE